MVVFPQNKEYNITNRNLINLYMGISFSMALLKVKASLINQ